MTTGLLAVFMTARAVTRCRSSTASRDQSLASMYDPWRTLTHSPLATIAAIDRSSYPMARASRRKMTPAVAPSSILFVIMVKPFRQQASSNQRLPPPVDSPGNPM